MNKENKRKAQERRALERKKAEQRKKVGRFFSFYLPIALVIVVVVVMVWAVATSGTSSSDSSADTEASVTETTETASDTDTASDAGTASDAESAEAALDTTEGLVAEDGDTVNIDFTGYLDGEAFEGGSTDGAGYDLTLGSGVFIDGFEEGVVGHSVGETFDLNLTFPEDYGSSDLAGKDVVFTVTLNGIYQ